MNPDRCCAYCEKFYGVCLPEHRMTVRMVNKCRDFQPNREFTEEEATIVEKFKLETSEDG